MKRILVLMATYNGEEYIKEQIDSIFKQSDVTVDLLISDDRSTDRTVAIIEQLILNGAPIKLIKRNIGSGSAGKNFMSLLAEVNDHEKYDAFAFSDQDDIWLPEKLKVAAKYLEHEADLYLSNLILWDQQSDKKSIIKKSHAQKKYDFLFEGGSAGCTYVFNKSFLSAVQPIVPKLNFKEWKSFSHDWFLYFFARINKFRVFNDREAHIVYRIHANNVHGHLNTLSFDAIRRKMQLVREGWYLDQIRFFKEFLQPESVEYKIYQSYTKNQLSRFLMLIKYNFQLIRSPFKFIQFFILSILS